MSGFGGFSFGAAAPNQQVPQFGTPTAQPTSGLTFGTPAGQTAPTTGFSFGSPPQGAVGQNTGGFSFGGGGPAATASPAFSFGAAATPGASMGGTAAAGSAFGGFGAQQTSTAGGLFGSATPLGAAAPSAGAMSFGQTPVSSFGQAMGAPAAAPNPAPATAFGGFGAQPAAAPATATPAFPFGGAAAAGTTTGFGAFGQKSATTAPASSFGGSSFGMASTPAVTPAPSLFGASTGAPSTTSSALGTGLSFGAPPANASPFSSAVRPLTVATSVPSTTPSSGFGGFGFGGPTAISSVPALGSVQPDAMGGTRLSQLLSTSAPTMGFGASPVSTISALGGTTLQSQSGQLGLASTASTTTAPTVGGFSMPTMQGFGQKQPEAGSLQATTLSAVTAVSTTAPLGGQAPVAATAATTGFSFGGPKTTAADFTLGGSTSTLAGLLAGTPSTNTAATTPSLTTTTSVLTTTQAPLSTPAGAAAGATAVAAATPSINFRKLEETINKWSQELEEQERLFLTQATQVNAWDRVLIADGEKITQLNDSLERVKLDQDQLGQEIDFISSQQRELEELLVPLERSVESMPNLSVHQHADLEREQTFHMAENIDGQLRQMSRDLKDIIAIVNATGGNTESSDPIQQIGKILNAHMDSLQWIDQNSSLLQKKIDEVSGLYEIRRQDHERGIKLPYM